ncbi:hypothetical protein L7F22_014781 [Adiantum nelumboides]|nr:hypothetical protein [Adiantum nelumboides]
MTRWAEALPTSKITAKDVANFIFNNICCRFGTPLEIISDRGPGFRGDLVGELMEKLGIKRRHSTPYYPQCNGLVEKVNGMICKIITKHVGDKAQKWDQHLDAALWAYRTSLKASLGYTPFQLVYGQEALLPIEVELSSLRVLQAREGGPKEKVKQRILALEKLELDREEAILHYVNQVEKRRINFNKKLKAKDIKENSLVLRYHNSFDNKKDGKFVPHWEGPFKVVRKYDNGSYQLMNATGKLHKAEAKAWFNTLLPANRGDWAGLRVLFLTKFGGGGETSESLWGKVCELRQGSLSEYNVYEVQFVQLWEQWVASLRLGKAAPDFLKKDHFVAGLWPPLREKVKGRFPVTWVDDRDIAHLKERKIRYQLQQREADQEEEGVAPVPPTNAPAAHRGKGNQDQQELLSRITHQLEDLSVHLPPFPIQQAPPVQILRPPVQPQQQQPPPPPPPVAPNPPLPIPENRAVNVISLDAKVKAKEEERGKSMPKDKGKAKVEDVDATPIKRARQEEAAMSETGERRKSKENGESSSKKKSKPRRKLTIKDFALGESSQPYNLVDDVSVQVPKITWPQLLHFAPKVRRQWTKMVSTRRVKTKAMGLVSGRNLQDITTLLNAYVKGQRVSNVYVDGGAQICVMTEQTMHRLGLKVNAHAPCKPKMANNSKVKCLGVINGLKIKICEIEVEVDVYVMPTEGEGYPIILVRCD